MQSRTKLCGFTLLELSVVLIVIGLVIGGVLVGRDLIAASEIRAQMGQIEKYRIAVNTFAHQNNCLPGDCKAGAQFGGPARGNNVGQGDGNEALEGWDGAYTADLRRALHQVMGETSVFWVDLSIANLIDGNFNTANMTSPSGVIKRICLRSIFPSSKIEGW